MLKGIDVSSNNPNITPSQLPQVEFCLVKATEGIGYVNCDCDYVVQDCISHGLPWGFYHYAKNNDAKAEARYFIENTRNYFGHGIPILDWEENQNVSWVNLFCKTIYEETGIHPWIYANPWRFNQGGVDPNCARWIADYPDIVRPSITWDPGEPPNTDGLIACWQFASDGQVSGYNGNLDVNIFYGDVKAWQKYVGISPPEQTSFIDTLENDTYKVTVERK